MSLKVNPVAYIRESTKTSPICPGDGSDAPAWPRGLKSVFLQEWPGSMLPGCRASCCLLSQTLFPWVPAPLMPPEPCSFPGCRQQPRGPTGPAPPVPHGALAQVCQHFRVCHGCTQPVLCLGLQHLSSRVPEISHCSPASVGLIRLLSSLAVRSLRYVPEHPGSSWSPQWMP